jgi:8-oxo-dGTP diphosphatase
MISTCSHGISGLLIPLSKKVSPLNLDLGSKTIYSQHIMIIEKINSVLYWAIIGILLLNIMQRKHHPHVEKKRTATVMLAVLVLILNMFAALILQFELPQWTLIPALLVPITVGYLMRSKLLVFTLNCTECDERLSMNNVLYHDDNLCDACRMELHPELFEKAPTDEEVLPEIPAPADARSVEEIDWDLWEPTETAVICYIFHEGKVLLINKKTGLGNGMINAPGGRIEDLETAREAAVRETIEETGITPLNLREVGILDFQFIDGYALKGYVFFADDYTGELTETDEADPFWVDETAIPYEQMWEDDQLWLPKAIAGSYVIGRFIFDDRTMLSSSVTESRS